MREGSPSLTAQAVAAYRLGFERQPAPFGDPEADLRLSADLATGASLDGSGLMSRYLQARTTFFDRVLLNALSRGTCQVVAVGAGYDGRAWRYAKPGVRWFELDHPTTQADKRARLARLGLDQSVATFVAADFSVDDAADALLGAGLQARVPALFMCEGVAVYLDRPVLESLLAELRSVAAFGSKLAISFSASFSASSGGGAGPGGLRERIGEKVAAKGEPARTTVEADEAATLLRSSGWAPRELSERAQRAGFVTAVPAWTPLPEGEAPLPGSLDDLLERANYRAGEAQLPAHLASVYGTSVTRLAQLDLGVYRVERADGPSWVARVFARSRPLVDVQGDAGLLAHLQAAGYPAERLGHREAVSVLAGQAVLLTGFVAGSKPSGGPATYSQLGDLIGRLHGLGADALPTLRAGGGWHHIVHQGTVDDEMAAAAALVEQSELAVPPGQQQLYQSLLTELVGWPKFAGLPQALVHPDFVPPNVIEGPEGLVLVDWAGTGLGPRLPSLGFLLWAAGTEGQDCVDAVMEGYLGHVTLETTELDLLEAAIGSRRLVLQSWAFCMGRESLAEVAAHRPDARAHAQAVAARARALARRAR